MIIGIVLGLVSPAYNDFLMSLLEPALMTMLFLIFLKIDPIEILRETRRFGLMFCISLTLFFVVPAIIYYLVKIFDETLALGLLLLTIMPAATSSAALTDIAKGNVALSTGITILTSLTAPFSVPLILGLLANQDVNINHLQMFWTLFLLIFIPILLSQIAKKIFTGAVNKTKPAFSAINVLILFIIVYAAIGSQREFIINNPYDTFQKLIVLYVVFIFLHIVGYLFAFGKSKPDKIAITVSRAYMNISMAIVLAAGFFQPPILILIILSTIPWNTLLFPFQKALKYLK